MRCSGKKGEMAANQCENLLKLFQHEGLFSNEVFSKRTKNGECRISNCVKYDLGHGYRLVTIKKGQSLLVPYLGTHDETDMWLDRHRCNDFGAENPGYVTSKMSGTLGPRNAEPKEQDSEENVLDDPYEEQLLAKIDDSMLGSIFQGFYQKQQK